MIDAGDFAKKQILFLVSNAGDKLSFNNDNVVVKDKDGKIKHQSTCYRLFMICVIGNFNITSGLIQRAKKFGFAICLMTTAFKVYDILGSRAEGNTILRKKQYKYDSLDLGKYIVCNKIRNQRVVLSQLRYKNEMVKEAIQVLKETEGKVLNADDNIHTIMGMEGTAAKSYFPVMFPFKEWQGRKPRIKCDYINSTLDIGYTMLFNIVDAILNVYGFDTYCGVLHRNFYMRKSLTCDLMEPIRPIIDYQVRKSINLGQFTENDFEEFNRQYRLSFKNNTKYIAALMQPILEEKDNIFKYIQSYYRCFMKEYGAEQFPMYEVKK